MTYGSSRLNKLELHHSTFISRFSFSTEKYGENAVKIWNIFCTVHMAFEYNGLSH